ncbi:hypothetical protein SAMN05421505_10835 [Sinosporangium album]|uniref:WD40 repeat n=1 Tax=Sinosporangium album TaxID=504805 RepID=A0A1G7X4L1_9ACTN|nr:WD40 repeat domain-containing protein [Sinosporangium album]SDG79101.1 hypothetical protein SAMN05421505_10835 [Sinosporangium album]
MIQQTVFSVPHARCLALAPDSSALVSLAGDGLTLREAGDHAVWSAALPESAGERIVWSADGDHLYVVSGGGVARRDPASGRPVPLSGPLDDRDVTAFALSCDGRLVAVGGAAGALRVLSARTGEVLTLPGGPDPVTALAFRPGTDDLCAARPGVLQFWNAASRMMYTSAPTAAPLRHLAWSPDGTRLVGAGPAEVVAFDPRDGTPLARLPVGEVRALAFSRTGDTLLVAVEGAVRLLDRNLASMGEAEADVVTPGGLHVSQGGLVAVRTGDDTVSLWTLPDTLPPGGGSSSSALRRWAIRHGLTLGRAPASLAEAGSPPVVPTLMPEGGAAFTWWPDGRTACREIGGAVVRLSPPGVHPAWRAAMSSPVRELAVSPDGRFVAAVCEERNGHTLHLLDGATGALTASTPAAPALAWTRSPGGEPLLAMPEDGPGAPREIVVMSPAEGYQPRRLPMHDGLARLAWSPDGRRLAATGPGRVVLWDAGRWVRSRAPLTAGPHGRLLGDVAWSPDGRWLAAVALSGQPPAAQVPAQVPAQVAAWVVVWDTATWETAATLGPCAPPGRTAVLAWSPGSEMIAFPSPDGGGVELWSIRSHNRLRLLAPPQPSTAPVRGVHWSALGDLLVVAHDDGAAVQWDLFADHIPAGGPGAALPHPHDTLVHMSAAAASIGSCAPLSLLSDLLCLVAGKPPADERLRPFARHPRLAELRALRWPPAAQIGLAVLLAADVPGDPRYEPPPHTHREELAAAMARVLSGSPRPVAAPELKAGPGGLFDGVDDHVLGLLSMLGPEAVAEDPALPARLRHQRHALPALSPAHRRLLDLRIAVSRSGRAQGRGGGGEGRAGLARHGHVNALLPTQLALPPAALAARHIRDELLYRTQRGSVPPQPRAMVLVLDDTPAAHGPAGVTLRVCAHLLARSLLRRGLPGTLVTLGEPARAHPLGHPADLTALWLASSVARPDLAGAFRQIAALAPRLSDPVAGPPRVVVLTHAFLDLGSHETDGHEVFAVRVRYRDAGGARRKARPLTGPRTLTLPCDPRPDEIGRVLAALLSAA